jgi:hypothetical protein
MAMPYKTDYDLIEVPDRLWDQTLLEHGFEANEKVDAFYEPKDENQRKYRTHAIYAPSSIIRKARAKVKRIVTLFVHENGHGMDFEDSDHPYDVFGVLRHAHFVGFDDRAYSGYLRWRKNKQLRAAAHPWLVRHGMA